MKKTVIILVVFLITQTANAQLFGKERILNRENLDKKTLSWGYYLGFNNYDYYFDYKEQNQGDNTDILEKLVLMLVYWETSVSVITLT